MKTRTRICLLVLPLLSILLAACAAEGLPWGTAGDLGGGGADLVGVDTVPYFVGVFTWLSATASAHTVCDNGGSNTDRRPSGDFAITRGPGPGQVNIGAGTGACPIFVFAVSGTSAALANAGMTCPSGPGTLTTRSGSLATSDGGRTVDLQVVLDVSIPNGGSVVHCVLSVSGKAQRKQ